MIRISESLSIVTENECNNVLYQEKLLNIVKLNINYPTPTIELGILSFTVRSERGDGSEALVLVAPRLTKTDRPNICGVAFVISLMRLFQKMNYLHRDVHFLFPENNTQMQIWVDAYRGSKSPNMFPLRFDNLGIIQAGLSIEIDGEKCDCVFGDPEIEIFGGNGLQPNLDFVHALEILGKHRDVKLNYSVDFNIVDDSRRISVYLAGLAQILQMICGKAFSDHILDFKNAKFKLHRSNIHSAFLRNGIDMATLRFSPLKKKVSDFHDESGGSRFSDQDSFE